VGGYGGLIVLETSVNGEKYTLYYGHIDITNSTLKKDDTIKAGEKLANLSPACSTASGGERKHLHFGIRKGTTIDIRGYVPNKIELSNWINPKVFLMQQNAKEIQ
jgi:murein DD-endopeptidase MepM/ murein hydrolase activator NlpD